ncbi:erythromycin esterase family protein [Mucilaginibacter sp.]|uniref:erythromycin esterase family protein n=1 Tax=Mucilaginibacter sp. TaxID=1882438 RepID=UPI003264B3F0
MLFFITSIAYCQDSEIKQYIKENSIRIDTLTDDNYLRNFEKFSDILKSKKVIGLGEATHGTHEFFQYKYYLLRYLVEMCQVKNFGIEANYTECRVVNDYILYSKGNIENAISGLHFWTWDTKEVLTMVKWMHDYNRQMLPNKKLKFYGFDLQYDEMARDSICKKIKILDSAYFYAHFKMLLKIDFKTSKSDTSFFNRYIKCHSLLDSLKGYISTKRIDLSETFNSDQITSLFADIRLIEECLEVNMLLAKGNALEASHLRDKFMCENIRSIVESTPNSKIVIWAHNGHISKVEPHMGFYLKETFGTSYYAIGFDFNGGRFRAIDPITHQLVTFYIKNSKSGSSGNFFSNIKIGNFFIDLDKAENADGATSRFFNKSISQLSIGAVFFKNNDRRYYLEQSLYQQFDGLFFIDKTTPSIAIK